MPVRRQKLLLLYAEDSGFNSAIIAWTQIDGTCNERHRSGDSEVSPYASVYDAICDGWRLIQMPEQLPRFPGAERETAYLPFEFVLEQLVEMEGT